MQPHHLPLCSACGIESAVMQRPRTREPSCRSCFCSHFEEDIHQTIMKNQLFKPGDKVAMGASGGKDSTVLIHILKTLNQRYGYGIEFVLVSVDEGIKGYRDAALCTVHQNAETYQLPLHIVSYEDLFGWTMDDIARQVGPTSNCTFCGVFRRQALEKAAVQVGATCIATGHNADDAAETLLLNLLRGDGARLELSVSVTTGQQQPSQLQSENSSTATAIQLPRVKPLRDMYQKEIVLYAHYQHLIYFSTECTHATEAFRGKARELLKELEALDSTCIAKTIQSGELIAKQLGHEPRESSSRIMFPCRCCGFMSSQTLCRACLLLRTLNKGRVSKVIGSCQN